ncbi:hypothetical protein ACKVMT_16430 [Halobacteriales archaeon Cl-PHB]
MSDASDPTVPDLSDEACQALRSVELGVEWVHRAHGDLVGFHHKTGKAMEHLDDAERELRECGHEDLADELRGRFLPLGVIDDDRWSYDVLETYQAGFFGPLTDFRKRATDEVADGHRHVAERRQEEERKRRAADDRL